MDPSARFSDLPPTTGVPSAPTPLSKVRPRPLSFSRSLETDAFVVQRMHLGAVALNFYSPDTRLRRPECKSTRNSHKYASAQSVLPSIMQMRNSGRHRVTIVAIVFQERGLIIKGKFPTLSRIDNLRYNNSRVYIFNSCYRRRIICELCKLSQIIGISLPLITYI